MSAQQRKSFWPTIIALAISFTAILWASARTKMVEPASNLSITSLLASPTPQSAATSETDLQSRLARQPEVFKLNRLLGQRLKGQKPVNSVLVGTLTVGDEEQVVRILRHQDKSGESIEVIISNKKDPLTWNAQEGAKSKDNSLTKAERLLVERLTLDSPDQFVLAQLRGASYYTIARNIRPEGATDDYTGPLWNIVRVNELQINERNQWQSQSRLYYINSVTGLIDKILTRGQEETIMAELSDWTEIDGEKVPSRISWSRQGQVVMRFSLTSFAQGNK